MTSLGHMAATRSSSCPSALAAVALLVASSMLLLLLAAWDPAVAVVISASVFALLVLCRAPLPFLVFAVAVLALLVDPPFGRPADGHWQSPLYPVGRFLYENLNTVTGIGALRVSLIELLLTFLVGRALLTRAARIRPSPTPRVLVLALGVWLLTIVWLEVFGLARGGDLRNSLWQLRTLLWLPIVAWLFLAVMRGPRDFLWIARAIVGVAVIKVAFGLYFLLEIARPRGLLAAYVMTHDDTVLLVTAIFICLAAWLYRPSRGHLVLLLTAVPWILVGIIVNNRRIAYVSLFGALMILYAVLDRRTRRVVTLAGVLMLPLFVSYLFVGQHRSGRLFAPAGKIMSVLAQSDASSSTRDIENYNLYVTLRAKGRLFGSGFGHEYVESVAAYDISANFAQYRFIAHNSVLWLWSIGGLVGMTALWVALVVTVYFASRSLHVARNPIEQTAAVTVNGVVLIYLVQAWGDMGTQSWVGVWILAAMIATAGKLATATGAWPAHVTVFGGRETKRVGIVDAIAGR